MNKKIKKSIDQLIAKLIEVGLVIDQNFTSISEDAVQWSGNQDISICLKNIDYRQVYHELNKNKIFSMKFVDGALIQLQYKFGVDKTIIEHRLAYFPSPMLNRYEDRIEEYDPISFEDDIFRDVIDEYIITTPFRIDYSPDQFVEDEHPKCHMHFGQIESCRIPVIRPLFPDEFIRFILKNFYNKLYRLYLAEYNFHTEVFNQTIAQSERSGIYISIS